MCDQGEVCKELVDKSGDAGMETVNEGQAELHAHTCSLSKVMEKFFLDETSSDMALIVEKQRFSVHKNILAIRSDYFRAMFYGNLKEAKQTEIELKETAVEPFKLILQFAYSSKIDLKNLKEETILDALELARRYIIEDLEIGIYNYLKTIISVANICVILNHAIMFQIATLTNVCIRFAESSSEEFLKDQSFLNLSATALIEILSRDSFYDTELVIFRVVRKWIERNKPENVEDIVRHIRLPLIDVAHLLKEVRTSTLFPDSAILSAVDTQVNGKYWEFNFRRLRVVGENLASPAFGAKVIGGNNPQFLLNGDSTTYDNKVGYTWHVLGDKNAIIIELKKPYTVNSIKMLLWDLDEKLSSYYIQVSVNGTRWFCLIDNRVAKCKSWQTLRFPPTVARFIRIVGTYGSGSKYFCVVSFECSFNDKLEK